MKTLGISVKEYSKSFLPWARENFPTTKWEVEYSSGTVKITAPEEMILRYLG